MSEPENPTAGAPAETEVFSSGETQGLAWSQADLDNVVPYVKPRAWTRWALAVSGVLGIVVAAYIVGQNHKSSPDSLVKPEAVPSTTKDSPVSAPAEPSASVVPTLSAPPSISSVDRDSVYLSLLQRADVHFVTDAAAINNGHAVCRALDGGETFDTIAAAIQAKSPQVTYGQVAEGVGAAIFAYCPQYQR